MLRLIEHYTSIQGECDRTGVPTQFVRFAGCNLRCPGWPCDTEFAIEPKLFMKTQRLIPVRADPMGASRRGYNDGLLGNIVLQAAQTGARNVCLTGGEPMLQSKNELIDLVRSLVGNWGYTIEMFTNGTIEYPRDLMVDCSIRMDWKLAGSGEPGMGERETNYYALAEWPHHTIKFTIKDNADFEEAVAIYEKFEMASWPGSIYAGPVWDQPYTAKDVAESILAFQLPWKLNVQLHNYVWPAHERAR